MTAAALRILMGGRSLHFPGNIPPRRRRRQACALKPVRLAGFWRLHPIVPDRTAFGAAVEGETDGDHGENQSQSPQHGLPTPDAPLSYGLKSGIFKPRAWRKHRCGTG